MMVFIVLAGHGSKSTTHPLIAGLTSVADHRTVCLLTKPNPPQDGDGKPWVLLP